MYLGLDLRGGVHFLMQVDMKAALTKKADAPAGDVRTLLRDKNIRHAGITRDGNAIVVRFRDPATLRDGARRAAATSCPTCSGSTSADGADCKLVGDAQARRRASASRTTAIKQNITTLHNRVNELGVAEPVIQQQGADRIVVAAARRAGHRARPRTSSAAPRRWKCAWSTRAPRRARPRPAPARCRSAPSATSSAAARR